MAPVRRPFQGNEQSASYPDYLDWRDGTRTLGAGRILGAATVATFVPLGFSGYKSVTIAIPGYVPAENESMTVLSNRITDLTTLEEYSSLPLFPVRLASTILSSLGLVALVLAATGLNGVMAYRVAQRWRELAVRTALGATRSELFGLVFGDGVRQAIVGIVVGVLSAGASRPIASRLPRLSPPDAAVFAGAVGVLAAIALFAVLLPALRASRVDPSSVLRGD